MVKIQKNGVENNLFIFCCIHYIMQNSTDIEDLISEYLDINEDLDEIKHERQEKFKEFKEKEEIIKKYLDEKTIDKSYILNKTRIYVAESQIRKGLNLKTLISILSDYFDGNDEKASEIAEYIWTNRQIDYKSHIKISKSKRKKNK